MIAPTEQRSNGNAEEFTISGFNIDNSISLLNKDGTDTGKVSNFFEAKSLYTGNNMSALFRAEVINLSRNIIITGTVMQNFLFLINFHNINKRRL